MRRRKHKVEKSIESETKLVYHDHDAVSLSELPKDILNEVASRLFEDENGRNGIIALSQTNHAFYEICSQDKFWGDSDSFKERLNQLPKNGTQALYNSPPSIRSLIGSKKQSLLEQRNDRIRYLNQKARKEYYELKISSLMSSRNLDIIEMICLISGHFLWVLNLFVPINKIFIFLPLFILAALFSASAAAAMVIDWAAPPMRLRHYSSHSRSFLFGLGCRTLEYYKRYNAPKASGRILVIGSGICVPIFFFSLFLYHCEYTPAIYISYVFSVIVALEVYFVYHASAPNARSDDICQYPQGIVVYALWIVYFILLGGKIDNSIEISNEDLFFYAKLPFGLHFLVYFYLWFTLHFGFRETRLNRNDLLGGWLLANAVGILFFCAAFCYYMHQKTNSSLYIVFGGLPFFLLEAFTLYFSVK